jgi:hypothetical protein
VSGEWLALAEEADAHAANLRARGEHGGAWDAKADLYRRAAESIRLEAETGAPHCACCLKAIGPRGKR